MERYKHIDLHVINNEAIVKKIREVLKGFKSVVISGEEGVGKITNTLGALQSASDVYYIGNPVDYVGKPRPKGYDRYINYITSLKNDMHIIADEGELLAFDASSLPGKKTVLVIDEIFGRSEAQYKKIIAILNEEDVKVLLITGCLKNVGRIIHHIETVLMLTKDGALQFDKEFAQQICSILKSESL
ncbi:MAG TPA: hypothetical protein VF790_11280 [Dissulfurispiraceae bacterium]